MPIPFKTCFTLPISFMFLLPAAGQAAGICGQPEALVHGAVQISGPDSPAFDSTVQINRGEPAYIELAVQSDTSLTLETFSNDVDPLVILFDEHGTALRSDDDGAGNLNSRLGTYLTAGSYCAQISTVREVPPATGALPAGFTTSIPFRISAGTASATGQCANTAIGITVEDPLAPGRGTRQIDGQSPGGEVVRFSLSEPTTLSIFARSNGFDRRCCMDRPWLICEEFDNRLGPL